MSSIDSLLYRPLRSGKEYEALIPTYKGIDHNFDKPTDNSNTYDTLKYMSEWAYKYASQMSKVAPLLKGRTVQETVTNIYKFLYHHFQYKLDGELQNLYSPSAAWHFRNTGFDCKTYSILASTILQNLSIPHSFRMVQQAGIMPGEWSHVYVTVSKENYVIDATTHDNKEVRYTKKHDYIMKHRGLASPYTSGLGCACQGSPITNTGLGAPAVLSQTIRNFHNFLNELEKNGVSRDVTNKMMQLVKWNIENGIDPNMGEILKKSLQASPGALGLTSVGIKTYNVPLPTASLPGNIYQPATSASGSLLQSGIAQGASALNNVSISGINVGGLVSNLATGNFIGAGIDVLKAIIPIDKTFGAVFANGFDLSCWGSSYSEQKAKEDIQIWLPFIIDWSGISKNLNNESMDKFQFLTQCLLDDSTNGQRSHFAKCTRKGWSLVHAAITQLKKDVYESITSQGIGLVPLGKKKGATWKVPLPRRSDTPYGWATPEREFDSLQVVPPPPPPPPPKPVDANGKELDSSKSSSITPVAIGGALLLAAKLLL